MKTTSNSSRRRRIEIDFLQVTGNKFIFYTPPIVDYVCIQRTDDGGMFLLFLLQLSERARGSYIIHGNCLQTNRFSSDTLAIDEYRSNDDDKVEPGGFH